MKISQIKDFLSGDIYKFKDKLPNPWRAISSQLLGVDELPQGALARYEKDVASVAYTVAKKIHKPVIYKQYYSKAKAKVCRAIDVIFGDRYKERKWLTEECNIEVPVFAIGTSPQIRLSEIKAKRFYIVDRAQKVTK